MASTLLSSWPSWALSLQRVGVSREIAWSLAIVVCAALASHIHFKRAMGRRDASVEERRQSRAHFRNTLILITLGLLGFVWGGEIRSLILSLAAIAAAAIIVSKELISCFYGSLIFTFSKLARIGDSIELGTHKGELLDHNWLSLTLMELSESHYYSGRIVKIPTSALLASPLVNLSQGGAYRFATMLLHARQEDASAALRIAQQAAIDVCAPWTDQARACLEDLMSERLTHAPDAEPKATLISVDKDSLVVSLRFAVPNGARAATQAEVSRRYFEGFEAHLLERRRLSEERVGRSGAASEPFDSFAPQGQAPISAAASASGFPLAAPIAPLPTNPATTSSRPPTP